MGRAPTAVLADPFARRLPAGKLHLNVRAVVTGAAGFVGSHLCDRLLAGGNDVVGIDCFTDFYPRRVKELNIEAARQHPRFTLFQLDLAEDDLSAAIEGADVVFHLASRSGLPVSANQDFAKYVRDNLTATQRLLDALVGSSISRFVYASSSSIYGDADRVPTKESSVPQPLSAYGLTKLAGENLVHVYARNLGLPVTCLRYFTLYGPRQRPDMAIARFMQALAADDVVDIFGDGEQTRDFTFVSDAVEATVRAATAGVVGKVLNIGGGCWTTINAVLAAVEGLAGKRLRVRHLPAPPEDQRNAAASINLARRDLVWEPKVSLREGLAEQWAWFQRTHAFSHRGLEVA